MRTGIGAHQGPRAHRAQHRRCAPPPTSRRWSRRPACPSGCAAGRWPRFDALAGAEGHLHRRPPEQVHFHEVGGLDAIVDVVGTCAALELLDVDEVARQPGGAQGIGMIAAPHGVLPNPPPPSWSCCAGAPTYRLDVGVELTTPTGAALLAALVTAWGPCRR